MKKILILLAFFYINAFACALCAMQTPVAHVELNFEGKENNLTNIHVKWTFSPTFTEQLYYGYDTNENNKFEENEKKDIEQTLIDYLKRKNYLAQIAYYDNPYDKVGKEINMPISPKNDKLSIIEGQIYFDFDLPQNLMLKQNRVIKVEFLDDEGYFLFMISNDKTPKVGKFNFKPNINISSGFYEMTQKPIVKDIRKVLKKQKPQQESRFYTYLTYKLTYYTNKIRQMFKKSQDNFYALVVLMFFSFAYGLFHAAGPGHGKMLVGSYFLANGGSYSRAFLLCLKIGFIHVIGAFLLVLVSVYMIRTFVSQLLIDVTRYTTIIASIFILILAFYLIYRKLTHKSTCSCSACNHDHHENCEHDHHHEHNKKEEWGIALAAGLVPCPGTVAIFILAFTFGNYLSGFLSAVSLALGMSVIIFVISVFGNYLHIKVSNSFNSLLSKIEYIGLILLVILGVLMLLSSF